MGKARNGCGKRGCKGSGNGERGKEMEKTTLRGEAERRWERKTEVMVERRPKRLCGLVTMGEEGGGGDGGRHSRLTTRKETKKTHLPLPVPSSPVGQNNEDLQGPLLLVYGPSFVPSIRSLRRLTDRQWPWGDDPHCFLLVVWATRIHSGFPAIASACPHCWIPIKVCTGNSILSKQLQYNLIDNTSGVPGKRMLGVQFGTELVIESRIDWIQTV